MKKTALSLMIGFMALSVNAQASALTGLWCDKYDDFISVLKIDEQGNLAKYSQGVQAGEIVVEGFGSISMGASGVQMQINGVDQKLSDIAFSTSGDGKRTLFLNKSDGSETIYQECKAK